MDRVNSGNIYVAVRELESGYDESTTKRREYLRAECVGGYNFALTLRKVTFERTQDEIPLTRTYFFLKAIVDFPNAGSLSWEARRFIRRCPVEMIAEFCEVLEERAKLEGKLYLDMDDYFWECEYMYTTERLRDLSAERILYHRGELLKAGQQRKI